MGGDRNATDAYYARQLVNEITASNSDGQVTHDELNQILMQDAVTPDGQTLSSHYNDADVRRMAAAELEARGILGQLIFSEFGTDTGMEEFGRGEGIDVPLVDERDSADMFTEAGYYSLSDLNNISRGASVGDNGQVPDAATQFLAGALYDRSEVDGMFKLHHMDGEELQGELSRWVDGGFDSNWDSNNGITRYDLATAYGGWDSLNDSEDDWQELDVGNLTDHGVVQHDNNVSANRPILEDAIYFASVSGAAESQIFGDIQQNGASPSWRDFQNAMNDPGFSSLSPQEQGAIRLLSDENRYNNVMRLGTFSGYNINTLDAYAQVMGTNVTVARQNAADRMAVAEASDQPPDVAVPITPEVGQRMVTNADGSMVTYEGNRILQVMHPNGEHTTFRYNDGGLLVGIASSDGQYNLTFDGTNWRQDAPGTANDTQLSRSPVLNADGSYTATFTDENGAAVTETHRTDGLTMRTNANGHVIGITFANNPLRTVSIAREGGGAITSITLPDGTSVAANVGVPNVDALTGAVEYTGLDGVRMRILPSGETVRAADAPIVAQSGDTGQPQQPAGGDSSGGDGGDGGGGDGGDGGDGGGGGSSTVTANWGRDVPWDVAVRSLNARGETATRDAIYLECWKILLASAQHVGSVTSADGVVNTIDTSQLQAQIAQFETSMANGGHVPGLPPTVDGVNIYQILKGEMTLTIH